MQKREELTFLPLFLSFDEHHRHVVYVGAGGTGADEAAHPVQGVVGVVLRQNLVNGEARRLQAVFRASVHQSPAASVGPSVPSEPTENTATPVNPSIFSAAASASS